jgi:hypothetical protein
VLFSYDDLTTASEPYYQSMLARDSGQFFKWRLATPYNQTLPPYLAFHRWWMCHGRVDFKSFEDTRRYRRELFELIQDLYPA